MEAPVETPVETPVEIPVKKVNVGRETQKDPKEFEMNPCVFLNIYSLASMPWPDPVVYQNIYFQTNIRHVRKVCRPNGV